MKTMDEGRLSLGRGNEVRQWRDVGRRVRDSDASNTVHY